jgi:hypothetical protein
MTDEEQPQEIPYRLAGGLAHGQTGRLINPPASRLRIPYMTGDWSLAKSDVGMRYLTYTRWGFEGGVLVYEFERIE